MTLFSRFVIRGLIILLITAWAVPLDAEDHSHEDHAWTVDGLLIKLEINSGKLEQADPIYAKVSLVNTSEHPIRVPVSPYGSYLLIFSAATARSDSLEFVDHLDDFGDGGFGTRYLEVKTGTSRPRYFCQQLNDYQNKTPAFWSPDNQNVELRVRGIYQFAIPSKADLADRSFARLYSRSVPFRVVFPWHHLTRS